jgi:hypothetical protein
LRFANPSPPSGWIEDLHLQAVDHARHTRKAPREAGQSVQVHSIAGVRCREQDIAGGSRGLAGASRGLSTA